jgi:hypothetical protein
LIIDSISWASIGIPVGLLFSSKPLLRRLAGSNRGRLTRP